jgi:hypothetical protein
VTPGDDGDLTVDDGGKPTRALSVRTFLAAAFGNRLEEVRTEIVALATSRPPKELNCVAAQLYERFLPDVAKGAEGWSAKGLLHVDRIRAAVGMRGV